MNKANSNTVIFGFMLVMMLFMGVVTNWQSIVRLAPVIADPEVNNPIISRSSSTSTVQAQESPVLNENSQQVAFSDGSNPVQVVKEYIYAIWTEDHDNIIDSRKLLVEDFYGGPGFYVDMILKYKSAGAQRPTEFTGGLVNGSIYPAEVSAYFITEKPNDTHVFMVYKGKSLDLDRRDSDGNFPDARYLLANYRSLDDLVSQTSGQDIIITRKGSGFMGPLLNGYYKYKGEWYQVSQLSAKSNEEWTKFMSTYGMKEGDSFRLVSKSVSSKTQLRVYFGLKKDRSGKKFKIDQIHQMERINL